MQNTRALLALFIVSTVCWTLIAPKIKSVLFKNIQFRKNAQKLSFSNLQHKFASLKQHVIPTKRAKLRMNKGILAEFEQMQIFWAF